MLTNRTIRGWMAAPMAAMAVGALGMMTAGPAAADAWIKDGSVWYLSSFGPSETVTADFQITKPAGTPESGYGAYLQCLGSPISRTTFNFAGGDVGTAHTGWRTVTPGQLCEAGITTPPTVLGTLTKVTSTTSGASRWNTHLNIIGYGDVIG